jgi:hypothetical protein
VRPSGQIVGAPAAHEAMSQSCVPATPRFGQTTVQLAPAGQSVWQGPLAQAKRQSLSAAQAQVPFAHVPSQRGFDPSHVTWQGGAPQANEQLAPVSQVQSPLAHVPLQADPGPQSTWQGGLSHAKAQVAFAGQAQAPFEQSATTSSW